MNLINNCKVKHNYFLEKEYEAGLILQGWEVKSIRAGQAQLGESYINSINREFFIIGMHISPLSAASSHVKIDPIRSRKILLKTAEMKKLIGKLKKRGYALMPLNLHCNKKGYIKLSFAEAFGKKLHDKRRSIKNQDWVRQKQRIMKNNSVGKLHSKIE